MQSASIVAQSITIERFPPPPVGALRMPLAERAQSRADQTTKFQQRSSNNVVQITRKLREDKKGEERGRMSLANVFDFFIIEDAIEFDSRDYPF